MGFGILFQLSFCCLRGHHLHGNKKHQKYDGREDKSRVYVLVKVTRRVFKLNSVLLGVVLDPQLHVGVLCQRHRVSKKGKDHQSRNVFAFHWY